MNPYLLCIGLLFSLHTFGQQHYEVRYIGNMGIALVHNDSAIIIDALHDYYEDNYLVSDTSAIGAMLKKQTPFSSIIAMAITHKHNDHFDSKLIHSVAAVHSSAKLFGGSQVYALLTAEAQKKFIQIADTASFRIGSGLTIYIRRIPHTYAARHAAIENYRYEINWNGFRLVHFGDADTKPEATAGLVPGADVLIIPNWFLSNDAAVLINPLKPGKIIATHIAPGDNNTKKHNNLQAAQILFKNYGDKLIINKR